MAITPRTVSVSVEIQSTLMWLKDIRDTVKSVVAGAVDGMVRTVSCNVIQGSRKKGKKAKARK